MSTEENNNTKVGTDGSHGDNNIGTSQNAVAAEDQQQNEATEKENNDLVSLSGTHNPLKRKAATDATKDDD